MKLNKNNNSISGVIFDICNHLFLALFSLTAIIPFIYILACSLSTDAEIKSRVFFLIPHNFTLEAYKYIFSTSTLVRSIGNSFTITLIGTVINLLFTVTMAYPLTRKNLSGTNIILNAIIVTMVFGGGMIPTYILVKSLGLLDSYWSLWLPGAIGTSNLILAMNFFRNLPDSLEEAATIDGCTEIQVLFKIILPLSKPMLATFALFYGVGHWNNFMGPLLYINDNKKWPLTIILRQFIMMTQSTLGNNGMLDANVQPPDESMKMGVIVISLVPILAVYPFLQKYFAKGVMVGAIKG